MTVFAGIDLAWTPYRESGICIWESHGSRFELVALEVAIVEPAALADRLASLGPDVIVAIDAPLIIGADRTAERQLARVFGRYHASAYTASETFLANAMAGPHLAAELCRRGFSLRPADASLPGLTAVEVYPNAAHVVLFGLPHILRYKKGRLATRREVLTRYQSLLRRQLLADGLIARDGPIADLLDAGLEALPGRELKRIEDQLDAVTCALVAISARRSPLTVFGCRDHGHIAVPGLPAGAVMPRALCLLCPDPIDRQEDLAEMDGRVLQGMHKRLAP